MPDVEEALEESGSSEVSPDDPADETPFSQSSDLSASNIQEFEGWASPRSAVAPAFYTAGF